MCYANFVDMSTLIAPFSNLLVRCYNDLFDVVTAPVLLLFW